MFRYSNRVAFRARVISNPFFIPLVCRKRDIPTCRLTRVKKYVAIFADALVCKET